MTVSNIKKTVNSLAEDSNKGNFQNIVDETAEKNSIFIFITDYSGNILYGVNEYKNLYDGSKNKEEKKYNLNSPHFFSSNAASSSMMGWEMGAVKKLLSSNTEKISQFVNSEAEYMGYSLGNGSSYIYGQKITNINLSGEIIEKGILYIHTSLDAGNMTTRILQVQLLWVSALSLILASIFSYFISHKFEKPVYNILKQAEKISKGKFPKEFEKGFCTELDELSDTLKEMAFSLEKLEKFRRELLAGISHDLRTPLTMIRGYSEMIREISWNDEERRNQDLTIIIHETDRLTALVNEILEYSSMQSVARNLTMDKADISSIVKNVLRIFETFYAGHGYIIKKTIEPDLWIRGNKKYIERVIQNFMDNAVNHTGNNRKIDIYLRKIENNVRFEVKDYGQGIKEEEIADIWDRYYTSRNMKNNISGLGLSIAREILTSHNAHFGVESDSTGSLFWFELESVD